MHHVLIILDGEEEIRSQEQIPVSAVTTIAAAVATITITTIIIATLRIENIMKIHCRLTQGQTVRVVLISLKTIFNRVHEVLIDIDLC